MITSGNAVDEPTAAVKIMTEARKLPDALMGGTKAMKAAGTDFLPREAAESIAAYDARLARTSLFPGYAKTVNDMADKVFAKPIVIKDDVPKDLIALLENVDLQGRHLDIFAHSVMVDALHAGISYIVVDMANAPLDENGNVRRLSRAQEIEMRRRPWAVHVRASQVRGWRSKTVAGIERLTQFRWMETVTEPEGEFGEKIIPQIRVLTQLDDGSVRWEVHRNGVAGANGWTRIDSGPITIGELAVCPVYANPAGFMAGLPPMAQLAEINKTHWQSQSDQRNILHVARVPILFGAGFEPDDPVEIGSSRMLTSSNPEARLAYVEHTGAAIASGRQDLKDLEFQMQTLGLELLVPRPSRETATGAAVDQARMNTSLAMMARALQDALEQMLGFMALYKGLDRDNGGGSLIVNTDFGVSLGSSADGPTLTEGVKNKIITRATWVREMKRRAVLSEDVDPETEVAAAINEGLDIEEDEAEIESDNQPPLDNQPPIAGVG